MATSRLGNIFKSALFKWAKIDQFLTHTPLAETDVAHSSPAES